SAPVRGLQERMWCSVDECRTLRVLLLLQRTEAASGLGGQSVEQLCSTDQSSLHSAGGLRQQHLAALEIGKLAYLSGGQGLAIEIASLDHQKRVCLGEVTQSLRDGDSVTVHECECRRAVELVVKRSDSSLVGCN